ncbi:glycosyltransferase [Sulfurovum sp.]|uniref:glycosyltransferase n=1 Tax=Sulfurovum sp. TaxID=1969726 RepID=UPI003569F565
MKKNAVVFTISSDLIFAVANIMMDIKKLSPAIADEVVIIHNGIDPNDLLRLNLILPTREIKYNIPVDDLSKFNQDTLKYFTIMAYAKYECLRLLDEYKNVIYLDPDMVILKDLSSLLEKCESGIKMMPSGQKVSVQLHEEIKEYNMQDEGICGCIFVFQDHADYTKLYNFCIISLNKYASKLKLAEQAIFDFMIQEFNLEICPIDSKVYSPHPTDKALAENAKILHAYGQPKFWNGLENSQWNDNYSKWITMGGTPYKPTSLLKKIVRKLVSLSKRILQK